MQKDKPNQWRIQVSKIDEKEKKMRENKRLSQCSEEYGSKISDLTNGLKIGDKLMTGVSSNKSNKHINHLNWLCEMACLNCKMINGVENTKVTKAIRPLQDTYFIQSSQKKKTLLFLSHIHLVALSTREIIAFLDLQMKYTVHFCHGFIKEKFDFKIFVENIHRTVQQEGTLFHRRS